MRTGYVLVAVWSPAAGRVRPPALSAALGKGAASLAPRLFVAAGGTGTRSAPLHVLGEGVGPGRSAYDVKQIPIGCEDDVAGCGFRSPKLRIITARWGDLDDNGLDANDIALASNKLKEVAAPGALTKPRVMLVGSLLRPYRNVNVLELQNTIDPLASVPQPTGQIKGPQSCPSD